MYNERIKLISGNHEIFLDAYCSNKTEKSDAIIVIPGGGYAQVCDDREGEPIALAYKNSGINAFVLHYKTGAEFVYPDHLGDAQTALNYIKENADKFSVNKDRIFAVGFSAGGHLAGMLALCGFGLRGAVLSYPVVSAYTKTHKASFENLLGKSFDDITEDEKKSVSLEKLIKSNSVPMFIWHTAADTVVPMCGSLALADAYYENSIPVSLRIFPYGDHGVALGTKVTECGNPDWNQPLAATWLAESVEWMKTV